MVTMKPFFLTLILFALTAHEACAVCSGTFINPVTDVCWSCMFPMQVGAVDYGNGQESPPGNVVLPACTCASGASVIIGVSIAYWEHARLIETVKDPYCFPALGTGMANPNPGMLGGESRSQDYADANTSFKQVHWYVFPVWSILQLFMDFPCAEQGGFDLGYLSEVDPMWGDDSLSFLVNPEALLFGNPVTQLSCVADSVAATVGFPLDPLFWCFGSWGSAYPLTGTVAESLPINSNPVVAARMIFKLGREGALFDTGISQCAGGVLTPIMVKSHYKLQIARPVVGAQCIPIGRPSLIWGSAKNPPMGAGANSPDNFLWVVARKRICCVGYNAGE
jgi:conjugal transfer pilus assembly protein TraU